MLKGAVCITFMGKLVGSMLVINTESNMRKLILILFGLYILSGCATQVQKQAEQADIQLQAAVQAYNNCKTKLQDSAPRLIMQKRFIFDKSDPKSFQKLSINEHINEEERNAIFKSNLFK